MKIDNARREGNALILETSDPAAWRWLYNFKAGEWEITKKRKKRSLDANRYLWKIIGDIAAVVGLPSDEVYRMAVHEAGVYTPLPIRKDAIEEFTRIWAAHGTGWIVDVVDDSKIPGYKLVRAYNGSSTYDTRQMSRLIDYVLEDARSLGIETLSERERSLLLDAWTQDQGFDRETV